MEFGTRTNLIYSIPDYKANITLGTTVYLFILVIFNVLIIFGFISSHVTCLLVVTYGICYVGVDTRGENNTCCCK